MKIAIAIVSICAIADVIMMYCLARAGGKDDERNGRK